MTFVIHFDLHRTKNENKWHGIIEVKKMLIVVDV